MLNDTYIREVGNRVDQLMSIDIPSRNVINILYSFARSKTEESLCMGSAKALKEAISPGDVVFITTGWPDRPHITPAIAETDGPPGAAALARALHRGLGAIPIVLIEQNLVAGMSRVMQAAEFRVMTPQQAILSYESRSPIHGASVIDFPTNVEHAKEVAKALIDEFNPAALISIEKGGMNDKGKIHTSRGDNTSTDMAKADYLFIEGNKRNILTVGIGDGGNEIGMGNIEEEIKANINYGSECRCGCGGGIAPATKTDHLVATCISNWGAYGVSACLAALCEDITVMHDERLEQRILIECANASFIDGILGIVMPGSDGLYMDVCMAYVKLLNEIVIQSMKSLL